MDCRCSTLGVKLMVSRSPKYSSGAISAKGLSSKATSTASTTLVPKDRPQRLGVDVTKVLTPRSRRLATSAAVTIRDNYFAPHILGHMASDKMIVTGNDICPLIILGIADLGLLLF